MTSGESELEFLVALYLSIAYVGLMPVILRIGYLGIVVGGRDGGAFLLVSFIRHIYF